jgi:NAD(P)-dependent dehydrogenase (short-subunit alcohol dehydrogenase family)
MSLDGRAALVTGAARGMGREHCLRLAGQGAAVGALDIDEPALAETVAAVRAQGGEAVGIRTDVSDRAACEEAVARFAEAQGRLDVVVSNAGTIHAETGLADTDDADWDRTLAVHVGGARNITRAALPWLQASPAARIIIISSMWAQRGPGFGYAYCAAKGALLAFGRNLAVELGPAGICVNAIAPGSVPTRMAASYGPAEIAEDCQSIPLGRWADASEIADVVCFLASDASSYLTGQTLAVNGGQIISGS